MGRRVLGPGEITTIIESMRAHKRSDGTINYLAIEKATGYRRAALKNWFERGISGTSRRAAIAPLKNFVFGGWEWPPPPLPEAPPPPKGEPLPLAPATLASAPVRAEVVPAAAVAIASDDPAAQVQKIQQREMQLAQIVREASVGGGVLSGRLLGSMDQLTSLAAQQIREATAARTTTPEATLSLLERLAKINDRIVDQARQAVALQREIVGAPTSRTEIKHTSDRPAATGNIESLIARAAGIADRLRAQDARKAAIAREMSDSDGYQGIEGP